MIIGTRVWAGILAITFAVLLTGCSDEPDATPDSGVSMAPSDQPVNIDQRFEAPDKNKLSPNVLLADHVHQLYVLAWTLSKQLQEAIADLVAHPDLQTMESAQRLWAEAHDAYLLASIADLLNISHPILDMAQSAPVVIHNSRTRIDQHPMIPGYLDSVSGYPKSGLMHAEVAIDFDTLNAEHQFSDSAYVTMGFHALEFMLFGDPTMEQERFLDYQVEGKTEREAKVAQRRAEYVQWLTGQLQTDIALHVEAWAAPEGFYRSYVTVLRKDDLADSLTQAIEQEEAQGNDPDRKQHISAEVSAQRLQWLQRLNTLLQPQTSPEPEDNRPNAPEEPDKT